MYVICFTNSFWLNLSPSSPIPFRFMCYIQRTHTRARFESWSPRYFMKSEGNVHYSRAHTHTPRTHMRVCLIIDAIYETNWEGSAFRTILRLLLVALPLMLMVLLLFVGLFPFSLASTGDRSTLMCGAYYTYMSFIPPVFFPAVFSLSFYLYFFWRVCVCVAVCAWFSVGERNFSSFFTWHSDGRSVLDIVIAFFVDFVFAILVWHRMI